MGLTREDAMPAPAALTRLEELVSVGHSALLVVDPQHDFCSPDGAVARRFGFDMQAIGDAVPRLNRLIDVCRAIGLPVVWIRGVAADGRMFPNQRVSRSWGDELWLIKEGSPGAAWFEEVRRPLESEPVITKDTYDAFAYTDLDVVLRARGVQTVIVSGFTTNVCVETTARHAFTIGYYVVVVSDCTGAPTRSEHDSALHNLGTYFGTVTDSLGLFAVWGVEPG